MTKYYYNQADSRWADKMYSSTNNKSQTMKSSGCGPTSAAMIVSAFREVILPDKMADLFMEKGFRTANDGTSWAGFKWISQKWSIKFEQNNNFNKMLDCLKDGGMVVAACSNGLFTTNGHLLVIAGIEGENLLIYDSYLYNGKFNLYDRQGKVTVNGTTVYCTVDNFKKYSNATQYFCYISKDSQEENKKNNIINTIGQIKTFSKNTIIYEKPDLTGKEYDYLANTTVKILENLGTIDKVESRITGRVGYVSNVNLYKEDISESIGKSRDSKNSLKTFKDNTIIYEKPDLTGTKYDYLANTTVYVLESIGNIDKIKVRLTGRVGYVPNNVYK